MKYNKLWLSLMIIIALMIFANYARASEVKLNTLDFTFASYHTKRCYAKCTKKFNERNYGLSATYDLGNHKSLIAGTVKNSFDKQSFYGGINFYATKSAPNRLIFRPGLMLGLVNGYKDTPSQSTVGDSGIVPLVSLNLSTYYKKRFHFNTSVFPAESGVVFSFRTGFVF